MGTYQRRKLNAVRQALDEARFGPDRTLNLRSTLPTVADAVARTEAWLRQQQVEQKGEVLVITGRGKSSAGGVSPVREAVVRLLHSLRRRGIVAEMRDHTPGSFVVRLAPVSTMLAAGRRNREEPLPPAVDPPVLRALEPQTRALLRELALRYLAVLGAPESPSFVESEMLRQFSALAAGVPEGNDREPRLRAAITRAIEESDEQR